MQVSTPTFSHTSGLFYEPFELELHSTTPDANVFYTLDSSDPTELSLQYTVPITIDSTTTLKAKAFKLNCIPSLTATVQFIFPVHNIDENIIYATQIVSIYPNPFSSETTIKYNLHEKGNFVFDIFNTKGQKIKSLEDGEKAAGHHSIQWNGKDSNGKACASGIYYCRLLSGKSVLIKKMMLMK